MHTPFNGLPSLIDEDTPKTPKYYDFWIKETPSPSPPPSPSPQRKKVGKLVFPPEVQQSIVVTIGSLLTCSGVRKSQRPSKPNKKYL